MATSDEMKEIMAAIGSLEGHVNRVLLLLQGNGDPEHGMQTRLIRLEDSVHGCQQASHKWRETYEKNTSTTGKNRVAIFCAVISAVATIIVALIALLK